MSDKFEKIIDPIDKEILKQELSKERFGRYTGRGGNEIYIINHHNSPNVMKEIGRLREVSFRDAGGGTGMAIDIDEFDICENCYEQLVVWDPVEEELVGGMRFIDCSHIVPANDADEVPLSTSHYFNFSSKFRKEYLPYTIELGRSWVQPNYQPSNNPRKGIYALDNIWDGLGLLTVIHPEMKYFFGKVTMYPDFHKESRDFILFLLRHYFPDDEGLVIPKHPIQTLTPDAKFEQIIKGLDFDKGYRAMTKFVRANGHTVPPLMNVYMHLSSTMKSFGTAINPDFGGVEETGIIVTIDDIYEDKTERHIKNIIQHK
ncbi:MAG: GNAT family N-acetyltransferase [Brumimicrobium sp.]|nr:GNAT family N-acetyltransferase [Brumimicrobium sp.]MCO5268993.1 GNAT family N-acetyltransferase [Brumimicrobium sp.]